MRPQPTKRGRSYLSAVGVQSRTHDKRGCAHREKDVLSKCSRVAESSQREEKVRPQREGGLTSVQSGCRVEPTTREGEPTKIERSYLRAVGVQSRAHEQRGCAHKKSDVLSQCSRGAESSQREERVRPQRGCLISVQSWCRVEKTSREGVPTKGGMSYLSADELQSRVHEKRGCAHEERDVSPQCSRGAESSQTKRGMSYLSAVELQSRADEKRGFAHKERDVLPQCS